MGFAEDIAAADLLSGGRVQLGISRGSPEKALDGWSYFGFRPAVGETDADMARRHTDVFLSAVDGTRMAEPNPRPRFPKPPGTLRQEPYSEGLRERIWWGAGSDDTARWAAERGMNLMASMLKQDESGQPLHVQQRRQIEAVRDAWSSRDHGFEPRVAVSRSIVAITSDVDRRRVLGGACGDRFGRIEPGSRAVFGRSYVAEPDVIDSLLAYVAPELGWR